MVKTNKKKICIVVSSLSKGGAERSTAILSQMLAALEHDIHIITILDGVDYDHAGTVYNLGEIKKQNDTFFGRLNRFRLFKAYVSKHNFDLIIDNRARIIAYREVLLSKVIYRGVPVIYVIHNYNTKKAFTKYKWLNKWLFKNQYMTVVSEAARKKFKKKFDLKDIRTIYNGFNFHDIKMSANETISVEIPEHFIVFFGRIDDKHKNLKLLLDAYAQSRLKKHDVKLLILGNGPDMDSIQAYANQLELSESTIFMGYINNPYPYVKKAKFATLTSRFEGFPMVIPESLSLGVPVVSVDCNSGPNEVIKTGYNGMLVENYNATKLSDAFNKMIEDDEFYNTCASNASLSVQKFSQDKVKQSWDELINEICQ
ncbi:glycosyltransferase [uncultured Psychroserpens sp.]|uniref:glycosyltransferase n=1 Tax=uncultured Psychroserpens sp. TaxID=255436 RepID=UPI0026255946|nr:glycosyltransferase [uncultured Psychroserpens sp.]